MPKKLVVFVLIVLLLTSFASAENLTPVKRADIEKLMRITGSVDVAKQMSDLFVRQMSQTIKASRPDIPERTFSILAEEINKVIEEQMAAKGGFFDMVIPIYARHFTHKDIKGLLTFYQSELGQKTIKVLPLILQESMLAGQEWGKALGPLIKRRVTRRFKKEGIDLSV